MLKKGLRGAVALIVLMGLVLMPIGANAGYSVYAAEPEVGDGSDAVEPKTETVYVPDDDGNNDVKTGNIEIGRVHNENPLTGVSAAYVDGTEQSVSLEVNGDVTVEGGASIGNSTGVDINGELGESAELNVNGNIKINADDYSLGAVNALAGDIGFGAPSTVNVKVDGDLDVNAKNRSFGLQTGSYNGDTLTTEIGGDITSYSEAAHSTGVFAQSMEKSKIETAIKGNIKSKSDGDEYAVGIDTIASLGGELKIEVDKDVSAEAKDEAFGISSNGGENGTSTIDILGGISAESSAYNAFGIQVYGNGNATKINVKEDVLSASRGSNVYGVAVGDLLKSAQNADTYIKVGGNVSAISSELSEEDWGHAYAAYVSANGNSETNIAVDGNLNSQTSSGSADGVYVSARKNDSVIVTTGGDIKAETTASLEEYYARGISVLNRANSQVFAVVDGDVVSNDTGIVIRDQNAEITDILVKGTIDANNHGIFYFDGADGEATITVWKIVLNDSGNAIERQENTGVPNPDGIGYIYEYNADEKAESEVMYIVKVEEKEGYTLKPSKSDGSALAKSHDFDVAHEGDKVVLDLAIADGYKLVGAFNGLGDDKVSLLQDEDGKYYYTVPKGGGVYLFAEVELVEKPEEKPEEQTEENGGSTPGSKEEPKNESGKGTSGGTDAESGKGTKGETKNDANSGANTNGNAKANAVNVPKTGDSQNVPLYGVLFMLSLCCAVFAVRKRQVSR